EVYGRPSLGMCRPFDQPSSCKALLLLSLSAVFPSARLPLIPLYETLTQCHTSQLPHPTPVPSGKDAPTRRCPGPPYPPPPRRPVLRPPLPGPHAPQLRGPPPVRRNDCSLQSLARMLP